VNTFKSPARIIEAPAYVPILSMVWFDYRLAKKLKPSTSLIIHPGVLSRLSRLSGSTITAHDLRRTYATLAHAVGIDPQNIKRLLNHTSTDITWRYIIYNPDVYRREVEIIGAGLTMLNPPNLLERNCEVNS
jgi:integrase